MKARKLIRNTLSLMLSILMLMSVVSIAFTAGAATCDHSSFDSDPSIVWVTIRETTCAQSGLKSTSCPVCHETVYYEIPLDPEAHVIGPWETVRPSTCTQTGLEERYCINGCVYKDTNTKIVLDQRVTPMHNFSRLYGSDPTCVKEGYEFVMCTDCLTMETRTLPIEAEAHKMSDWVIVKEATCNEDSGERVRYCLNCDDSGNQCTKIEKEFFKDYDNHTNVKWHEDQKVEATCYADGYVPGECVDCGAYVTYTLPQHSQAVYEVISRTEPTCISTGVERRICLGDRIDGGLTGCGYEYEVVLEITEDSEHIVSDWKIAKQPSCTPGLRYRSCIYHPDADREEELIPANGQHNYGEWVVTVEPDCSSTGLREKVCADCGDTVVEELPTKHNYLDWTDVAEMNCDETAIQDGTKLAKCNDCNYQKYFTVPAAHEYGLWVIKEKADCKTGKVGTMERYCNKCGKTETKSYTQEHDYCEWYISANPVCQTAEFSGREGMYTRYCKLCKVRETKSIPVTHEFTDWKVEKYPVCSADGSFESGRTVGTCKFCGATKTETLEGGHSFGEWVVTVQSDCSRTDGNKNGVKERKCCNCGFVEKTVVPVEHSYGAYELAGYKCNDAANGTEKLVRVCSKCNQTDEMILPENYKGHPNLSVSVVAPSCATSGYTVKYCPDCGYTERTDIVEPNGHQLDENWTTIGIATCTAEGSRYKACAKCDYLEFEYFEKASHMLIEIEPGIEPTCTTAGASPKSYCSVCGQIFESSIIPAVGHQFVEGSETCKICKVYMGTECACSCHSTSGIEAIIFKIINKLYQAFGINQYCGCGVMHYEEPGFLAKLFGNA